MAIINGMMQQKAEKLSTFTFFLQTSKHSMEDSKKINYLFERLQQLKETDGIKLDLFKKFQDENQKRPVKVEPIEVPIIDEFEAFNKLPQFVPLEVSDSLPEPQTAITQMEPSKHEFRHIQLKINETAKFESVERQAFHAHANRFGTHSSLEGDKSENPLAYLSEYCQQHDLTKIPVISNILAKMTQALSLCQIKDPNEYIRAATEMARHVFTQKNRPFLQEVGVVSLAM